MVRFLSSVKFAQVRRIDNAIKYRWWIQFANTKNYQKMITTYLIHHECCFVERQIVEIEEAFGRLGDSITTDRTGCPFRESYPDVLKVKSVEDAGGDNGTDMLDCLLQSRIRAN